MTHQAHRRRSSACWRAEGGNAAVEFAIIAPVLLVLILGAFVFGLRFAIAHSVQHLANEAARAAVAGLTEQERRDLAQRCITESIGSYILLKPGALTVGAAFDPTDPDLFTVALNYDATQQGPNLLGALLPSGPEQLARRATVRRGGP